MASNTPSLDVGTLTATDLAGCTPEQWLAVYHAVGNVTESATALCSVFQTQTGFQELRAGVNTMFTVYAGALVFIMHGGFAMLCAGALRTKNAMNILVQTVVDGAASALMFYLVGFGFAFGEGDHPNKFIGDSLFALARYKSHQTGTGMGMWHNWFFQWAFAATAATIPAGCVAERFNFNAYLGYSMFISAFVYPVVVHWVWSTRGWLGYGALDPIFSAGMMDFAGSGVVHMLGGLAGLVGAVMVGPRLGRFDMNGAPVHMPGHSSILVVLGTLLLWFGWYGFNPGSVLVMDTINAATVAGRAAVTTTLSGAAGGLACLVLGFVRRWSWDLIGLCNGMLCGFVGVTAGCHVLEPWAALICGALAACVFEVMCEVLLKLKIDDPLSAGPMHGFCGMFGVLYVGLLAKQEYVKEAYTGLKSHYPYGLFYGGGGVLLASQVIGVLTISAWVVGLMAPFFYVFKVLRMLRIPADQEELGLDVSKHGGSAYNFAGIGDAIMSGGTMGFNSNHPAHSHHAQHSHHVYAQQVALYQGSHHNNNTLQFNMNASNGMVATGGKGLMLMGNSLHGANGYSTAVVPAQTYTSQHNPSMHNGAGNASSPVAMTTGLQMHGAASPKQSQLEASSKPMLLAMGTWATAPNASTAPEAGGTASGVAGGNGDVMEHTGESQKLEKPQRQEQEEGNVTMHGPGGSSRQRQQQQQQPQQQQQQEVQMAAAGSSGMQEVEEVQDEARPPQHQHHQQQQQRQRPGSPSAYQPIAAETGLPT